MNKEWAEQNKEMQSLIKKAGTFEKGKDVLFGLRNDLIDTLLSFKEDFNRSIFICHEQFFERIKAQIEFRLISHDPAPPC